LNYLNENGRLVNFTNLDTFLPLREEYNDYMQWVASFFEDKVAYGEEVLSVEPLKENGEIVEGFTIVSKNADGKSESRTAKNVVVAAGGKPFFPPTLPADNSRIIHSAQYMYRVGDVLPDRNAPYKVAVVGAGQSAAEIYKDLHSRYPKCKSQLIFKAAALRPSDDSPL
jgi:L-ornithine N5-monooxygenase